MSQRTSRASHSRYRILFIDDDRALREMLIAAVDPACFHVDVAEGIDVAQTLGDRQKFDLLLCGCGETLAALRGRLHRDLRTIALVPTEAVGDPSMRRRPPGPLELRALLLDLAFDAHDGAGASG
jgi:hypothetical protein